LVTGSAKRIGREIALEFARRGARLAVHYRSSVDEAKEVAGDRGAVFQADLADTESIESLFAGVERTFGRLDILVNSASVFSPSTADEATPEHWDAQMNTECERTILRGAACRAPHEKRRRGEDHQYCGRRG
jgi:NAD(P)-dependent dehydrogenase (short-subunit alcohol dehydrogenase family)